MPTCVSLLLSLISGKDDSRRVMLVCVIIMKKLMKVHNPYCLIMILYVGTVWCGFKIVGDNFDKNFSQTYQRIDYQTVSRHYFHMYAVKDRVDLSELSDIPRDNVIDVPCSCQQMWIMIK